VPILSLAINIQLQNPILGSNCYLGSNSAPIVLRPANRTAPTFGAGELFDANGTPDPTNGVQSLIIKGTEDDSTFTVPGATGCGGLLSLLVDPVINAKLGLPLAFGEEQRRAEQRYLGHGLVTTIPGRSFPTRARIFRGLALRGPAVATIGETTM
jgi:hypothetical protein